MDSFVSSHLSADGAANGPVTMGHYTRQDLAFHYALADAFTVCDGYFCSVLGPTDPNRPMLMPDRLTDAGRAHRGRARPAIGRLEGGGAALEANDDLDLRSAVDGEFVARQVLSSS